MKILMVCLGNICRSPLAEGILQSKVDENGLSWTVDSAGTSNWHAGDKPDRRSVGKAAEHGIDITHQRGRQLRGNDLAEFDIIYAMDSSNYQDILRLAENDEERAKVKLIMNEVYEGENRAVPDPYYDDNGFELVYQMLDAACEAIIKKQA